MLRGFLIGLIGIFILLSFQFRSYIEPLVVMLAIPMALIGVVIGPRAARLRPLPAEHPGLRLAGRRSSSTTRILLVVFIKKHRRLGHSVEAAAAQAGPRALPRGAADLGDDHRRHAAAAARDQPAGADPDPAGDQHRVRPARVHGAGDPHPAGRPTPSSATSAWSNSSTGRRPPAGRPRPARTRTSSRAPARSSTRSRAAARSTILRHHLARRDDQAEPPTAAPSGPRGHGRHADRRGRGDRDRRPRGRQRRRVDPRASRRAAAQRDHRARRQRPARRLALVDARRAARDRRGAVANGRAPRVLISGDRDFEREYDEIGPMRQALLELGVDAAAIVEDPRGYRTLDSMARAHQVFGFDDALVVTNDFHVARAVYLGRHFGLDVDGVVADVDVDWPLPARARNVGREVLAGVLAFVDCHLLGTGATGADDPR